MTSPVDTSVKFFHSAMPGAPVMSGTAGAMLAVLDACLVNGFGLKSVDSLVIAGNVATVNISTGHSAEIGSVVLIAGATPAALNGEQKVTAITGTTVSFATTGLADQTATGSITLKMASAGWAKTFSGTNLAAYKPTDVTATGCVLRVDDTGTTNARVVGYESMSDVNTGLGPFPSATQRNGGSYWPKSNQADTTARNWLLIADGKRLYFAIANYLPNQSEYNLFTFGDLISTKSGDAFSCVIAGQASDVAMSATALLDNFWECQMSSNNQEFYAPRGHTGVGSSCRLRKMAAGLGIGTSQWQSGGQNCVLPYPNPEDGGLYITPMYAVEDSVLSLRGKAAGYYMVPQNIPNGQFATRDSIQGVSGLPGRTLKAMTCGLTTKGLVLFDITGPWA